MKFRLSGINNQNFLMTDEETGSWWQQISGVAVAGPLKGKRLTRVFHDEVAFRLWLREHPGTRVLVPGGRHRVDQLLAQLGRGDREDARRDAGADQRLAPARAPWCSDSSSTANRRRGRCAPSCASS